VSKELRESGAFFIWAARPWMVGSLRLWPAYPGNFWMRLARVFACFEEWHIDGLVDLVEKCPSDETLPSAD
jgi:hypothetical protein